FGFGSPIKHSLLLCPTACRRFYLGMKTFSKVCGPVVVLITFLALTMLGLKFSPDRLNHGFIHESILRFVECGLSNFATSLCRVSATSYARLYAMRAVMPAIKARASAILAEFSQAQAEIVGKAVILTDGKAGTVDHIWLDEFHGLRISIRG